MQNEDLQLFNIVRHTWFHIINPNSLSNKFYAGESDVFGPRILPSGELVRQTYPGPIRSVGVRPQLAVGMSPHPGMPPHQFAVQHRPVAGYSDVPRHEVIIPVTCEVLVFVAYMPK
jgi:hypothetical protein